LEARRERIHEVGSQTLSSTAPGLGEEGHSLLDSDTQAA